MSRDLNIRITGDASGFQAAAAQTEKAIDGVTNKVETTAKKTTSFFNDIATGFGIGIGEALVENFEKVGTSLLRLGEQTIAFGSHLTDLRDKTGLTLEELQRLNYAGATVGLSLDQIASAVNRLQKNLVTEGGGVVSALDKLNLNVDQLQAMSPGAMFEAMSAAVAKLPGPTDRAAAAMTLLGKSGADLLPLMLAKVKELGDAAPIMSDETVEALDRVDDAWATTKVSVLAAVGSMIGEMEREVTSVRGFVEGNTGILGEYFRGADEGYRQVGKAIDANAKALDTLSTARLPASIPALKSAKDAVAEYEQTMGASEKALRLANTALEAHDKAVQALADTYTGKALAAKIDLMSEALKRAEKQGGLTTEQTHELGKELIKLHDQGATLPPALERIRVAEKNLGDAAHLAALAHGQLSDVFKGLPAVQLPAIKTTQQLTDEFNKHIVSGKNLGSMLDEIAPKIAHLPAPPPDPWREFKNEVSATMHTLEGAVSGTFAQIMLGAKSFHDGFIDIWESIKGAASRIVADMMGNLTNMVFKGLANILTGSGSFGSAFSNILGSALGGGGSAVGAAAGAGSSASAGAAAAGTGAGLGTAAAIAGAFALPALLYMLQPMGPSEAESRAAYQAAHQDTIGAYWNTPEGQQAMADERARQAAGDMSGGGIAPDPLQDTSSREAKAYYDDNGNFVSVPGFAKGGYVPPRPGGTLARLAEAGQGEYVVPESKMGGNSITIDMRGAILPDRESLRQFAFQLIPHLPAAAGAYKLDIRG